MEADLQAHIAFFLTGKKLTSNLDTIDGLKLRPALFTSYRDLTRLRYDFPLVLVDKKAGSSGAEPLSRLIDAILEKVAKGDSGERIRKHLLRLESAIRVLVAGGASGTFSTLWDQAALALKADPLVAESLSLARANVTTDGEVIDCDAELAFKLIGHAWQLTRTQRAQGFSGEIKRLLLKLSDIIKADFNSSNAGKSAENLQASFGSGPMDDFDFSVMSKLLAKSATKENLSASRRARIESLLDTLSAQRFFAADGAKHSFEFDSCCSALSAYRERLPEAVSVARALAVAELEIKGEYSAAKHDALFESFGDNGLDVADRSLFPDYLVRLNAKDMSGAEQDALAEILAVDLPIKIVVHSDDILEPSPLAKGHLAFSLRSKKLAGMAMAMNGVFVLQSPGSNLYAMREEIQRGIDYRGPALYSIFSGAGASTAGLPPYLVGAAALEARAFPAFTFDPAAGDNWASRFSLASNPQPDADWPTHEFSYQDEKCQSVAQTLSFTLVDFIACDSRYGKHFSRVPKAHWHDDMIAVDKALDTRGQVTTIPGVLMVDASDALQKVIVDEKLLRETRRCRASWNSLQELGGIHNSHAEQLLASEKKTWEAATTAAPAEAAAPAASVVPAPVIAAAAVEAAAQRSPDEAYIETPRCSTCNECVQLNGKMFVYDGNRQAFIADVAAGTYAQLVQAAESCQVSIIHPGKPRDPNEAGLEELMKRAEAFR